MQENQIIYGQEQSNYRQNDKQNNLKQDNREKEVMEVSLQAAITASVPAMHLCSPTASLSQWGARMSLILPRWSIFR